jgi:hypothetical protein
MRPTAATTLLLAWIVPGGGHAAAGQFQKAAVFFVVLTAMCVIGLLFGGELFAYTTAEPLVFLAAAAEWAAGGPRLLSALAGAGRGDVVAVTYEYGNTFLIVAGLLNTLVALDALDVARGRKA